MLLCAGSVCFGGTVVVASSGDGAPDGNGTIQDFYPPVLNDSGQVAMSAGLESTSGGSSDNFAIFLGSGGGLTQIARKGQPAPDANGTFSHFASPLLTDSGQAASLGLLTGTSAGSDDNEGVFRGAGGPVAQVIRTGQACPDGNGVFDYIENYDINSSSQVMIHAELANTGGGASGDSGVFLESGGVVTRIAREDQAVPDGNGVYDMFIASELNDQGQVVFHANLSGTSGGSADNGGVFRGSGGVVTRIAREGQSAPDGNGTFSAFGVYATLNDSGRAAFVGYLTGTAGGASDNAGVFSGYGAGLTQIARSGQSAPDGNGVFGNLVQPLINNMGQTVFRSYLQSTAAGTSDDTGIFLGSGGDVTQIAREGQQPPDGDGVFDLPGFEYSINDSGHVLFSGRLSGVSGLGGNPRGLYISDGIDTIEVVREKRNAFGAGIVSIDALLGGDHERSGLNELGQVAYQVDLNDGREIIALFTPEIHWRAGSGHWADSDNWTLGIAPAPLYDVLIDPEGSLNVVGQYEHTAVKSLVVGSTGGGLATLWLDNGGDLSVIGGLSINDGGRIELGAGRVLAANSMINRGVLTGSGTVQAPMLNDTSGQIRLSAGQRMVIASPNQLNAGKIEVIGAEIEFIDDLHNGPLTGLITGSDAVMRFGGGLVNDGALALGFGTNRVHGEILNMPDGRVIVSGASQATFYGDVFNDGAVHVSAGSMAIFFGDFAGAGTTGTGTVFLEGDTRPGFSPGEMSFGGDVSIGPFASLDIELGGLVGGDEYDRLIAAGDLTLGGTLQVTLIDGFAPQVGDSFDILDFCSLAGGEFNAVDLPELTGRKAWDESALYTDGVISVIAMLHGDTDVDWDVDDDDYDRFVAVFGDTGDWRTDFNEDGVVDLTDFVLMRENFGVTPGSAPGLAPSATTPEPFTAGILVLGLGAVIGRKKR